nr:immunoglobulin heavy chain junction region [Mus musculus]NSM07066.1 immunoglobulin heavy chain junction region [Mus musculus]
CSREGYDGYFGDYW